jgi:hypothetical protein
MIEDEGRQSRGQIFTRVAFHSFSVKEMFRGCSPPNSERSPHPARGIENHWHSKTHHLEVDRDRKSAATAFAQEFRRASHLL